MKGQPYALAAFLRDKKIAVPVKSLADWAAERVWRIWKRRNLLPLDGNRATIPRLSVPWPSHCIRRRIPDHEKLLRYMTCFGYYWEIRLWWQLFLLSASTLQYFTLVELDGCCLDGVHVKVIKWQRVIWERVVRRRGACCPPDINPLAPEFSFKF